MEYVVEDTPLGTAGAVKMADKLLAGERFLDHLGRRAHRHRPDRADRAPRARRQRRHDRAAARHQPARIRRRRHRRSGAHHALPREAVVGRGVLRHDQHRHLRARTGDPRPHGGRARTTTSRKDLFPEMLRDGKQLGGYVIDALLDRHRQPRAVPAGELRRASRRKVRARNSLGTRDRARRSGPARTAASIRRRGCTARSCSGDGVHDRARRRRSSALTAIGNRLDRRSAARASMRSVLWEDCYIGEEAALDDCTIADRNIDQANAHDRRRRRSSGAAARSAAARSSTRTSSCGPTSG